MIVWQTLLGRKVAQGSNGCEVWQNPWYRWLKFDSPAIQTLLSRKQPERPVLRYVPALAALAKASPGNLCLLGLGGAAVVHYLYDDMKSIQIDVIDNNIEVIRFCKQWFMLDRLKNINVIHQDAANFIANEEKQYQHILIDLYNADEYPQHCTTEIFFKSCAKRLRPGGILSINLAHPKQHFPVLQQLEKTFKHHIVIPVNKTGNLIIHALYGKQKRDWLDIIGQQMALKRLSWDAEFGYVGEM